MVLTSQQFVMNCSVITGDSLAQQEPDPAFNWDYPMISLKIELLYVDLSYTTKLFHNSSIAGEGPSTAWNSQAP